MNFHFQSTQGHYYLNQFVFRSDIVLHLVVVCFLLIQVTLVLKQVYPQVGGKITTITLTSLYLFHNG